MKTSNNTVLIIGGSAGIGLEMAKLFAAKGNHVIITGRNKERLELAAAQLGNVSTIVSDATKEDDVKHLAEKLNKEFPALNILINNAAVAHLYQPGNNESAFEKASDEMFANYLSIVRLNEYLLPLLRKQAEAAIVNVSSIVAFVPSKQMPGYAASKAALHSYSQSLRLSMQGNGNVKVFELMPPLVNTEFSKEIGGSKGIAPSVVAEDLLNALENDIYEVHVGNTANMYELFRQSPIDALAAMNAPR